MPKGTAAEPPRLMLGRRRSVAGAQRPSAAPSVRAAVDLTTSTPGSVGWQCAIRLAQEPGSVG